MILTVLYLPDNGVDETQNGVDLDLALALLLWFAEDKQLQHTHANTLADVRESAK